MQKLLKLLDDSAKYLVAALLIIIPLYPKFPFIRIPGTYVAIRFEDFLLAITAMFAAIRLLPKIKSFFTDNITRSILVFFAVGAVSLISGAFLTQTTELSIGLLHYLRRIEYFVPLFFLMAYVAVGKKQNIEFYVKVLVVVICALFIYGFGQRYFNFPVIITQNEEYSKGVALSWTPGSHIASTFAGHYDLASFLVLVIPILISLIFVYKDKITKSILIGTSLLGFWLLVNSLSRVSLLSYIVAVSLALFLMRKYKAIVFVVIASVVLSSFSSSLLARYHQVVTVFYQKAVTLIEVRAAENEDRSSSIRFNVEWPRAVRALTKNPLLGTGYSSISLATDNDYLRLLGEVGVLGFLAFGLILFNIALLFIKALPLVRNFQGIELGFLAGVIGGSVGTLINAIFIDVFEASKFAATFWLLVGLSVIVIRNKFNEHKI